MHNTESMHDTEIAHNTILHNISPMIVYSFTTPAHEICTYSKSVSDSICCTSLARI